MTIVVDYTKYIKNQLSDKDFDRLKLGDLLVFIDPSGEGTLHSVQGEVVEYISNNRETVKVRKPNRITYACYPMRFARYNKAPPISGFGKFLKEKGL